MNDTLREDLLELFDLLEMDLEPVPEEGMETVDNLAYVYIYDSGLSRNAGGLLNDQLQDVLLRLARHVYAEEIDDENND